MADSSLGSRVGFAWRFPGRAIAVGAWAWFSTLGGAVGQCQKTGGIVVCHGPPDALTPQSDVRSLVLANEWFTPVREVVRQLYPNISSVECPFRGVSACSGDGLDSTCPCFAKFDAQTKVIDGTSMLPNICADDPVDLLGAEAEYVVLTTLGVIILAVVTRSFGRRIVRWIATCCRRTTTTEGGQGKDNGNQGSGGDDDPRNAAATSSIQRGGDDTREPFGIDWTIVSGLVEARAQLLAYSMAHESRRGELTGADTTERQHADMGPCNSCSGDPGNGAEGESDRDDDAGEYEVMRSPASRNPFLEENEERKTSSTRGPAKQAPSPAHPSPITSIPLMGAKSKPKATPNNNTDRSRQAFQQSLSHIVEVECEEVKEEEATKERSRMNKLRNSFAGFGKEISLGGRSPSLADIRSLGIDLSQPLDGRLLESLAPVFVKKGLVTLKGNDSGICTDQSGDGSRRRSKTKILNALGGGRSLDDSLMDQTAGADSLTTKCRVV